MAFIEKLTEEDWAGLRDDAQRMAEDWCEDEDENPAEVVMTSIGYVEVGLLSTESAIVMAYNESKEFDY